MSSQLFALAIFIFALALVGAFYPYNRGSLFTALIVLYALTAGISGYVACSYYRQMEGGSWVRNVLATSFTFCAPLFLVFCFNNTVAIVYRVCGLCPAVAMRAFAPICNRITASYLAELCVNACAVSDHAIFGH